MRTLLTTQDSAQGPGTKVPQAGAEGPGAAAVTCPIPRSRAENAVRKVLFVPERATCPAAGGDAATYRIFHVSIAVSALRCLLSYVVFPIVTPLLGAATRVGPAIGLPIAMVALFFDVVGIRRFWISDHRWKWAMTFLYAAVMGLVTALLVGDIRALA